ncbi:hypothetical protein [Herbaspirillum sp. RV1423]|uniref:hypothetical protein n=1 Tax=Herbaspirillum sp. RV1423 TaxID=1443993 RepID=UPI0012DBE48A|nr:hypothetical protein [Herbaspirillum sp. RV1423]
MRAASADNCAAERFMEIIAGLRRANGAFLAKRHFPIAKHLAISLKTIRIVSIQHANYIIGSCHSDLQNPFEMP